MSINGYFTNVEYKINLIEEQTDGLAANGLPDIT